jgi:hypothetical protein
MAELLKEEFNLEDIPIYLDNINNSFNKTYKTWPDNCYVFRNNTLVYASKIDDNANGVRNEPWVYYIDEYLTSLKGV